MLPVWGEVIRKNMKFVTGIEQNLDFPSLGFCLILFQLEAWMSWMHQVRTAALQASTNLLTGFVGVCLFLWLYFTVQDAHPAAASYHWQTEANALRVWVCVLLILTCFIWRIKSVRRWKQGRRIRAF